MSRPVTSVSLMTALSVSLIAVLAGCQRQAPSDPVPPPAASTAVATSTASVPPGAADAAYQPPTAEQLYALVAPIALFPDRLVALTLAASTHPDEIGAARDFLGQNGNLTGAALIDAADAQPWDPSVKSLVAFPAVLDQLANNPEWTAGLGAAYASEPTDVMNAIQVMRGRARAHGALQSSPQQTVQVSDRGPPVDETVAEDDDVVPAPAQTIVIEPARSDVVYVPDYDPDVVYGEPVVTRVYSRGWYEAPRPRDDAVATGLISFGAGILVGELFASHEHRDPPRWGWNAWNTSWGGDRPGNPYHGRPAITYDSHPYTVDRTTVINRTVNIDRSVHIDNRHDFNNVTNVRNVDIHRPGAAAVPPVAAQRQGGFPAQRLAGPATGRPGAQPDYAHMPHPNFTADMARPTAANARPTLPPRPGVAQPGQPGESRHEAPAARFDARSEQRPHGEPAPAVAPRATAQARAPHASQPQPAFPAPRAQTAATARPTQPGQATPRVEQRPSAQPPHDASRPEASRPEQRAMERPMDRPTPRPQPRPEERQAPRQPARPEAPRPEQQQASHEPSRPQPQHAEPPREQHAPPAHHDKRDDHNG